MEHDQEITLTLRSGEALILFDWLASLNLKGHDNEPDDATQQLLWTIEGSIEKQLAAVIDPEYKTLLSVAKLHLLSGKPS